jgi:hypothetical protein
MNERNRVDTLRLVVFCLAIDMFDIVLYEEGRGAYLSVCELPRLPPLTHEYWYVSHTHSFDQDPAREDNSRTGDDTAWKLYVNILIPTYSRQRFSART